jgi:ABC-type transport system involved in Fe-S cluster assembly fused permease/ATPase subunit
MIKQSMVDLENLFTLLDEPIEVADAENARRLEVIDAEVKVASRLPSPFCSYTLRSGFNRS